MKILSLSFLLLLLPLTLLARDDNESLSLEYYYKEAAIVAHVKSQDAKSTNRVGGYENWRITAEVIEPFKGKIRKGEIVEFLEPSETGRKKERFLGEKVVFLKKDVDLDKKQIYAAIENSTVAPTEQVIKNLRKIKGMKK